MKNCLFILSVIMSLTLFNMSCTDIIESDRNVNVVVQGNVNKITEAIEFYFANEVLYYKNNDTTELWKSSFPENWGKSFYLINRSNDFSIKITSIKMLDGTNFNINPINSLPLELEPNEVDSKNLIYINLNTSKLKQGIFFDKVIINDTVSIGFYVRVNVM